MILIILEESPTMLSVYHSIIASAALLLQYADGPLDFINNAGMTSPVQTLMPDF